VCSVKLPYESLWWSSQKKDKRVVWFSWEKLGKSKQGGGMGFRELETFNLALLAKQEWRILQNPESLVATILKEKYFPEVSFMEANVGRNCLMHGGVSLNLGIFWK